MLPVRNRGKRIISSSAIGVRTAVEYLDVHTGEYEFLGVVLGFCEEQNLVLVTLDKPFHSQDGLTYVTVLAVHRSNLRRA